MANKVLTNKYFSMFFWGYYYAGFFGYNKIFAHIQG
jgi:hypothetical protein